MATFLVSYVRYGVSMPGVAQAECLRYLWLAVCIGAASPKDPRAFHR